MKTRAGYSVLRISVLEMRMYLQKREKSYIDTMEFTANYTKALYTAAKANEGTEGTFELVFGQEQGTAKWTGMYHIHVTEGEVNGLLEMQIVVSPSSDITIE